ncbi:MAG: hypothetical protein OEV44_04575, partial [Spirochaetota bacterium]|nr:hypothetical protein [Spirochaetota bacterium]
MKRKIINNTKLLIICLLFIITSFTANYTNLYAAELKYKGEISFEHWGFPKEPATPNQTKMNNTVELKFETSLQIDFFKMLIAPRFKEDFSERSRSRLLLDEGWIQFASNNLELRLGIQQFTWGMVESQKLVDVLNQKDYQDDFLDPDKLGELSGRFRFSIPSLENIDFQFYYLTNFTKAKFPTSTSRYNLTNGTFDFSESPVFASSQKEWYHQYAFRTVINIGNIDLALSYFHGYNKFPSFKLDFATQKLLPYYYIMDQGGLELTWVMGKLIIKLESVYRNTSRNNPTMIPQSIVPSSYVAYVGGFEYTINQIIGNNDLTFFMEYLGDSDVGKTTIDYRLLQNDLFLGFRFSFNDINSKELKAGTTIDLDNPEEFTFLVEFTQRFKEV